MINKILVDIPGSSYTLKGMMFYDEMFKGERPTIFVIHGWTSEMKNYPERFQNMVDMGYFVFLFDLRGHGTTGGDLDSLTIKDHFEDVLTAYDYMKNLEFVDQQNISVFGSSYGGFLASLLTSEREFARLLLNVPALYQDELYDQSRIDKDESIDEFRAHHHDASENKALEAISKFEGDLLIIEAEFDERVPRTVIEDYIKAYGKACEHVVIMGSDHSMKKPGANEERVKIMTEWFKKFV